MLIDINKSTDITYDNFFYIYFGKPSKLFVKQKSYLKKWITVFKLKALRLNTQHFHKKLPCKLDGEYKMGLSQRRDFCY